MGGPLLAPLRIFYSFNNDGMDLCVWLQILQILAVESIHCRVLLLSLGSLLLLPRGEKDVQLEKDDSRQLDCSIKARVKMGQLNLENGHSGYSRNNKK